MPNERNRRFFQAIFSVLLQRTGNSAFEARAVPRGPRHPGQFSAWMLSDFDMNVMASSATAMGYLGIVW